MANELMTIKAKKLGVRLAYARKSNQFAMDVVSKRSGITAEEYQKFETGETSPSFPELERILQILGVPIEKFLESDLSEASDNEKTLQIKKSLTHLKDKMIAINIKKRRLEKGLAVKAIAGYCGIAEEMLKEYESGNIPIPTPILENICNELGIDIYSLMQQPKKDEPDLQVSESSKLDEKQILPKDLLEFVTKPENKPYIELAKKLSAMGADKLRTIAEGILEITY